MSIRSVASSSRLRDKSAPINNRRPLTSKATKSSSMSAIPPPPPSSSVLISRTGTARNGLRSRPGTRGKLLSYGEKRYDPLEDLHLNYGQKEGDSFFYGFGELGAAGIGQQKDDNEDEDDLGPSYLEKEMAYKKLNEELEKKSNEIFQRIEQFAERSRQSCCTEAGDGPDLNDSALETLEIQEDQEESNDNEYQGKGGYCSENSSRLSSSRTLRHSESNETISSIATSTSNKRNSDDQSMPPDSVDIKARKRLQRATESVVKCLQSKLMNYESRMTDLHLQFRQKIQENTMLESKVRAMEEDRERLLKSLGSLQNSADKSSKAENEAKSNLNLKMQAFAALKKDIELLKREVKLKNASLQNIQARHNRLNEENERLKNQTRSTQMNMRDKSQEDRSIIDDLQQRVIQLEQQKNILNATISKQSNLIKTLRNQRSGPDRSASFY